MASQLQIVYYGDQSVEAFESIEQLVIESQNSELLTEFLRSTFRALATGITALSCAERALFAGNSFDELARAIRKNGNRHVATSTVLSCVAQLGWTVLHREKQPEKWLDDSHRAVIGVCTGSLTAIAATVARSDGDILRLAPEFVLLALRLGVEVSRRSLTIEDNSQSSWSVAVSRVSSEHMMEAIGEYNQLRGIPAHKTVFISAQSSSGITLSGPPTELRAFLESAEAVKSARKLPLPVYGAFHATHLPLPDVDSILGDSELWDRLINPVAKSSLVVSGQEEFADGTLRELLSRTVTDILRDPLDFDSVIKKTKAKDQTLPVRLTIIGPAHAGLLKRMLSPQGIERFGSRSVSSDRQSPAKNDYRDAIAIVGMACRTPGAQNVDELWGLLMEGRDMHRKVPPDRFDVSTHYDPTGKIPNTTITQWGCFDEHVAEFDLSLFKMSPREALQTDPCHRLMLITGYEALESAGYYDPGGSRPKYGTFYGQAGDDYRQVNSGQNVDTNYITGGVRAFAPGRVSYYFGWEGPSVNVDTACSSSAVAINQACSSLRLGESDMALAGGANLLTSSDMFAGLSRAKFVSATGPCKTLDETADGYCRADGAGSVVLKRYEDAIRDKDNILGIIRSIETSHAGTAISITHPEAETQIALLKRILSKARLDVGDIDHVEMHGTGTQAGDFAETSSIAGLVEATGGSKTTDRPLTIASVKPNVGHSEGASGVTSLIKALLMIKHRINPRHIGIKTRLNPKLPQLAEMGIEPPLRHTPYLPRSDKRRVLVNNFNATGGVTAMIVEEHSPSPVLETDTRGHYPIVISAANQKSLTRSLSQLAEHLKSQNDIDISHLSYTLTARRLHHSYGFSCVASSVDELLQTIHAKLFNLAKALTPKRGALKSIVFVFTGQAISYAGMGRNLYKTNDVFRSHLSRSDAICRSMGMPSFLEVIDSDGSEEFSAFGATKNQLALVALEVALAYLLNSWGIQPGAVVGHSLGEYSALCVSGAVSLADTLYLVGRRAQLMESLCQRGEFAMLATSLAPADAHDYLSEFLQCQIACLNGPAQTVVGGPSAEIESLAGYLTRQAVKIKRLPVDYAFHSAQMDVLLPEYRRIAAGVSFNEPKILMASTCLGEFARLEDLNVEYLCQQTRQPVRFRDTIEKIASAEGTSSPLWVELGPAPACSSFIDLILSTRDTIAALDPRKPNWRTMSNVVTKYYLYHGDLRWDEYHRQYLDALSLVPTPSYPFDMTRHWIQYEGDWVITKNRGPKQDSIAPAPVSTIRSTTLHRLESDTDNQTLRELVFHSSFLVNCLPDLGLIYRVNGITYTPCSIYTDMAMTAASELWKCSDRGAQCPAMEMRAFELVDSVQLLEIMPDYLVKVTASQQSSDKNTVRITIATIAQSASRELARCVIVFGDASEWVASADATAYLYKSRMDLLEMLHMGNANLSAFDIHHRLPGPTVFENIQKVILNPSMFEVVAQVTYRPHKGDYTSDPLWIDALLQLPRLALGPNGAAHTPTGWRSFRTLGPLSLGAKYRAHVRMQANMSSGAATGDLHVFDSDGNAVVELKGIHCRTVSHPTSTPNVAQPDAFPQKNELNSNEIACPVAAKPTKHGMAVMSDMPRIPPKRIDTVTEIELTSHTSESSLSPPRSPLSQSSQTSSDSEYAFPKAPPRQCPAAPPPESASKPWTTASPAPASPTPHPVLAILAAELGLDTAGEPVDPQMPLEDMGVDSIMQMTLVAKMQESLPAGVGKLPGSLLVEHNSFAKLGAFFASLGA